MKKLVSSALALSVLFSGAAGIVNHNEAHAATKSTTVTKTDKGYSPIINFDILKSKSVVKSLKEGNFELNGVKLGSNMYEATHGKMDKPNSSLIIHEKDKGTIYSSNYELDDYSGFTVFTSLSKNDNIDHKTMKIQSMNFMTSAYDKESKDLTRFRDVSKVLGKPLKIEKVENTKEITYSKYLTVTISKKYKTWYVESINYRVPGFDKMQKNIF